MNPEHIAIIMDGNGRWASRRNHDRFFGHLRGARAAKNIIEHCSSIGVKHLTLYTFSNENWSRPPAEVLFLMRLLLRQLRRERSNLMKNNIKFQCIGNLDRLPEAVRFEVEKTVFETANNTGMSLVFALSYSGRQEICNAARDLASAVSSGKIKIDEINEATFSRALGSSFLPDPDLIIRTSGEYRVSNFLLWQMAYSELYFCEKMWPDFSIADLELAMQSYAQRIRRFGKVTEQLNLENTLSESNNHH